VRLSTVLGLTPATAGTGWHVVAGDALELLRKVPARSVDLVFADPPYHLSNGGTTCRAGKRASVDKGEWDRSRGLEEDHAFHQAWLRECQRVLKTSGTLWVSGTQHVIFSIGYALQELRFRLLNTVSWQKPNAPPHLSGRYLAHSTEILLWASPVQVKPLPHFFAYAAMKHLNGGKQMRDVWRFADPAPAAGGDQVLWSVPTPGPKEKLYGRHPTQKPVALLERVVLASTVPGAVVLDPFCGSATTGVAALAHGRTFVGIEEAPEYVALAARRLRAAAAEGQRRATSSGGVDAREAADG
jgi:site-specific DNA-methyltransferase (adenine-specific)